MRRLFDFKVHHFIDFRQTDLNLTLTEPVANKCGPQASSSGAYLGEIQLTVGLTPKSQEDKDQVGPLLIKYFFFLSWVCK